MCLGQMKKERRGVVHQLHVLDMLQTHALYSKTPHYVIPINKEKVILPLSFTNFNILMTNSLQLRFEIILLLVIRKVS